MRFGLLPRIIYGMKTMRKEKARTRAGVKLPSFLRGFASAFDITGQTLLDVPDLASGFQRDAKALRGDWISVGGDMRKAMDGISDERSA